MDQPQAAPAAPRSGSGFLVGSAIIVVLSGFIAVVRSRAPGRTAAYTIGAFFGGAAVVAVLGLIVYGIARAMGKTKPAATAIKIAFWVLFVLFLLNVVSLLGRAMNPRTASAQAAFTEQQRNGLEVGPDSIRNASLGFAFPTPGPTFVRNQEMEKRMTAQFGGQLPPDYINWLFRDTTGTDGVAIQVTGFKGLNEKGFRDFAHGMREGVSKTKFLSEDLVWNDKKREARLVTQHPNGLYLATRCVPSLSPRPEFIVCVQTISMQPDGLAAVRDGLTVRIR